MNILSLFNGISGLPLSFERADIIDVIVHILKHI